MKLLYVLLIFAATAGTALAQGPATFDMDQHDPHDNARAVQIFPNPTTEFVHIRLEHVNLDGVKVSMHNIIGNEINVETERIDQHELRIRVKDFDAGYYLLALKDNQSNFKGTYKFLKR